MDKRNYHLCDVTKTESGGTEGTLMMCPKEPGNQLILTQAYNSQSYFKINQ